MRIYACGCSFTYGDELVSPHESSWPALVAKKLAAEVNNDATSGGSNSRSVYHTIKNLKGDYDLYLIAWTTYSRFTFYKNDNNYEINFNPQLLHSMYGKEKFYRDWGKILYTEWYNELYAFKLWLQQIIQLQKVFDNRNYLMVNTVSNNLECWQAKKENFISSVSTLINFEIMPDEQIFDEYEEIQYYISLIDKSKFYNWGDFYITQLCNQFECGSGGHILEEGHKHLAELIYTHVQNKTFNS